LPTKIAMPYNIMKEKINLECELVYWTLYSYTVTDIPNKYLKNLAKCKYFGCTQSSGNAYCHSF
jgi:hypothetical protein